MALPENVLGSIHATLEDHSLVPQSCLTVFISGSMARGWQHARSDTDLYVVTNESWQGPSNGFNPLSVEPNTVPTTVIYVDTGRWEFRYWLDSQVDQVFDKVSWAAFRHDDPVGQKVNTHEAAFLARLDQPFVVLGEEWIHRRREQLAGSAFRSMCILRALAEADSYVEDALGMLESGDQHAAVLAAQSALGAAADALSLNQREYNLEKKWRARRMQAIASPILSFERYWELTTMRSFDPLRPEVWVESVLDLCRRVALEVEM